MSTVASFSTFAVGRSRASMRVFAFATSTEASLERILDLVENSGNAFRQRWPPECLPPRSPGWRQDSSPEKRLTPDGPRPACRGGAKVGDCTRTRAPPRQAGRGPEKFAVLLSLGT